MIRNIIKYTIGLPLLIIVSLCLLIGQIVMIIISEEDLFFIEGLKEIWRGFKDKK